MAYGVPHRFVTPEMLMAEKAAQESARVAENEKRQDDQRRQDEAKAAMQSQWVTQRNELQAKVDELRSALGSAQSRSGSLRNAGDFAGALEAGRDVPVLEGWLADAERAFAAHLRQVPRFYRG